MVSIVPKLYLNLYDIKKQQLMKHFLIFLSLGLIVGTNSCNTIDDEVYEMVGVYVGNVVGETGPFNLTISADGNDNITIEAPFDAEYWDVVRADIAKGDHLVKDINIRRQSLDGGVAIWGGGFYNNGTIQLDYQMKFGNEIYSFRIVATK